jgi:predicted dehydrogenase
MALQVLICGCGAVTERFYLRPLHELATEGLIRVAALADPAEERTARIGAQFPKARRHGSLQEALRAIRPDLVIVASPHRLHKEHTLASLSAGSHVLCEKPLALTAADCDEMIAAAERQQRVLGVGHFRRFFPSVQAIRSAIQAEVLGRPVSFAAFEGEIYRWPVSSPAGGVLADIGPHALDLLSWWLGPLSLASYSDDAIDGVEVNCRLELETAGGVRGTLRLSRDTVLPDRHVLEFERGWLAYRCDVPDRFEWGWNGATHSQDVVLGPTPATSPMWAAASQPVSAHPGASFQRQLRNVVAAIHGDAPLLAPPRDAREGIALIEQCYASKTPGAGELSPLST